MSGLKLGQVMACGCAAQGTVGGTPGCVVHGCTEPMADQPDLTGREMRCSYGGNARPSDRKAPFFQYRADAEHDLYYCGCYGWD